MERRVLRTLASSTHWHDHTQELWAVPHDWEVCRTTAASPTRPNRDRDFALRYLSELWPPVRRCTQYGARSLFELLGPIVCDNSVTPSTLLFWLTRVQ